MIPSFLCTRESSLVQYLYTECQCTSSKSYYCLISCSASSWPHVSVVLAASQHVPLVSYMAPLSSRSNSFLTSYQRPRLTSSKRHPCVSSASSRPHPSLIRRIPRASYRPTCPHPSSRLASYPRRPAFISARLFGLISATCPRPSSLLASSQRPPHLALEHSSGPI